MLENEVVRKIEDFVYLKPRSIQEISQHLGKNWRTVDRYVEEIIKEYGTLDKRIFREGTRGALKIVYWASVEKAGQSVFQQEMEKRIFEGKTKFDFSAFDIFQYVGDKNKIVWSKYAKDEIKAGRLEEFKKLLLSAKKQVLFFSGNLSFINFDDGKTNVFKVIEELVRRGISIKVICKVDFSGVKNVEKLLSLNYKYGDELIEIRHREQPLRVTVVDGKMINLKEIKNPTGRKGELSRRLFIFYTISETDWCSWLSKIFWKMFSVSIGSEKRIRELRKII